MIKNDGSNERKCFFFVIFIIVMIRNNISYQFINNVQSNGLKISYHYV